MVATAGAALMGSTYIREMANVLRAAGVRVEVGSINAGWENRARGSGGFNGMPIGIVWHHTASSASVNSDLSYMIDGSPDEPIGNLLLDREGIVWPIAAGGANTQGKGGPAWFSRGTCPIDSGNSNLFGMEVANNGVGEQWPQAQIDAYFAASNALNAHFGNLPTDLITHHEWAEDRKIDPAKAQSVQGPWHPNSINSSGTWSGDDIRAECIRRTGSGPPQPTPSGDLMFTILDVRDTDVTFGGNMDPHGIAAQITWLSYDRWLTCVNLGAPTVEVNMTDLVNCDLLGAIPPGFGPEHFANVIA
jgi:hypothetical protein